VLDTHNENFDCIESSEQAIELEFCLQISRLSVVPCNGAKMCRVVAILRVKLAKNVATGTVGGVDRQVDDVVHHVIDGAYCRT